MTRSLIEQWFPAAAIGAESLRERGASSALPPINFLHVWWARRPLTASRAAVVASLLPAWPSDTEAAADPLAGSIRRSLEEEFPGGEAEYHAWFLFALGIKGDPVAGRAAIKAANALGVKLQGNGYGYDRAFTVSPDDKTVERLHRLASLRANVDAPPTMLDPFSGGGSIPFEAARYGLSTTANELNPVAVAVLNGTVSLPGRLGPSFADVIDRWGRHWCDRVENLLSDFFPKADHEDAIIAYVWAHSVPCPSTGFMTPLLPNCWLATGKAGRNVAIRVEPDHSTGLITFSVVEGAEAKALGDRSTYGRGTATSVWDPSVTMSGEDLQRDAQNGRMGSMLIGLAVTRPGERGRQFRGPLPEDLAAVERAKLHVAHSIGRWEVDDLVPAEEIDQVSNYDRGHRLYGITTWRDFFSDRQLLTLVTGVSTMADILDETGEELSTEEVRALALYLALALDKAVDYNSRQVGWDSTRLKVRNKFTKHNYAFQWTFAEFDGASALFPWAVSQVVDAYRGIANLAKQSESLIESGRAATASIILGSATRLEVPSDSVDVVVTDPPYYDNVMYAECSDYFYVWEKRTLRRSWPELTTRILTDKEDEAVANVALYRDLTSKTSDSRTPTAGELANRRYERLLTEAFVEAHRVLKADGVLTVMFTHKRVDAWDTLGTALLEAGFEISSSWPVHTESENSVHQAKKNSASSTIMLGCRKRESTESGFWGDVKPAVERAAEEAAKRFSAEGIKGVDLTLATYGPALSVLSRHWPVYTGSVDDEGRPIVIRPDLALDLARERVAHLKKRELLGGRDVEFDRATDWWILAWNDFQAAQFPTGEALKLCIAMDLDLEDVAKGFKLIKAQSGDVTLLTPAQRRTAGALDISATSWPTLVDALHAFMLTYDEDGVGSAKRWLEHSGLNADPRFVALIEAAVRAIPRTKSGDEFVRPEARILESIRASLFADMIPAPVEPELVVAQATLFDQG